MHGVAALRRKSAAVSSRVVNAAIATEIARCAACFHVLIADWQSLGSEELKRMKPTWRVGAVIPDAASAAHDGEERAVAGCHDRFSGILSKIKSYLATAVLLQCLLKPPPFAARERILVGSRSVTGESNSYRDVLWVLCP